MNKNDLKLIIAIIFISFIFFLLKIILNNDNENKKALVYYDNKLIKTIDLTLNGTNTYKVDGFNGEIFIETKKGSIKVVKEKSPLHLCSKQGWINHTNDVIVCLPNKVIIKIISNKTSLDAIVR